MTPKRTDVVSASEISSWEWCPESWRLDASGVESANNEEIARGVAFHSRTAAAEASSRRAASLGWWLLALGLITAAISLVLFKMAG